MNLIFSNSRKRKICSCGTRLSIGRSWRFQSHLNSTFCQKSSERIMPEYSRLLCKGGYEYNICKETENSFSSLQTYSQHTVETKMQLHFYKQTRVPNEKDFLIRGLRSSYSTEVLFVRLWIRRSIQIGVVSCS